MQSKNEIIKKKVTFSVCTDKNECRSNVPSQRQNVTRNVLSKSSEFTSCVSSNRRQKGILSESKTSNKICDVRKTLVRNVEEVLPPPCTRIKGRQCSVQVDIAQKPATSEKQIYKSKYASPELYSTLCIAKEIQTISSKENKHGRLDICTEAKQMLDVKSLSKLNIPLEEKLYKDLVSLTVSDEELLSSDDRLISRREVEFRHSKDKEPKLSDFVTPSQGQEYFVVPQTEPVAMERIRRYNGFSLYGRSQLWYHDGGNT